MEHAMITVQATVNAPIEKVWNLWTSPEHIIHWNHASDDWHTPSAENDLKVGGKFSCRMESRDGSMGFDFGGMYDILLPREKIGYTMDDGRKAIIEFTVLDNHTHILETFEGETQNAAELQQQGWQSILDNFKKYAEQQA
jgi:uncharacterized protein YndB with AHSA1/START domain